MAKGEFVTDTSIISVPVPNIDWGLTEGSLIPLDTIWHRKTDVSVLQRTGHCDAIVRFEKADWGPGLGVCYVGCSALPSGQTSCRECTAIYEINKQKLFRQGLAALLTLGAVAVIAPFLESKFSLEKQIKYVTAETAAIRRYKAHMSADEVLHAKVAGQWAMITDLTPKWVATLVVQGQQPEHPVAYW